ncbi:hypothetical protein [Streptomyces sp. NPDC053048]|uniref:hypothetical protein n=1 Tax=Streptomyces sp. NPDC053048 TaxID=3365694 RepID=UPI0037D694B1
MHDTPTPPDAMTYRVGAYVIDTRSATLAQVMGTVDCHVLVRRPDGGQTWDVPPQALRLASRKECAAAGVGAAVAGCGRCAELLATQRRAVDKGERELAIAATIAVRAHVRKAHLCGSESGGGAS